MSSINKGNVIRRMNNEILQYYTPPLPRYDVHLGVQSGNVNYYYTGAAATTTAAHVSANISGNVFAPAAPAAAAAPAATSGNISSRNRGDLVFECRYGKMAQLGESYDHYYNNGVAIEMTVSINHPCMRTPKIYFELSGHYPFHAPLLWICHDYGPFPKYTCYGAYVERTSKLLWKIKALVNRAVNRGGNCAELFDTWRFLLCRECFCCSSKLCHGNWKPTFHLIDLVDEFYATRALKTKALALFHVHSICRHKNVPDSVEKAISSFF